MAHLHDTDPIPRALFAAASRFDHDGRPSLLLTLVVMMGVLRSSAHILAVQSPTVMKYLFWVGFRWML